MSTGSHLVSPLGDADALISAIYGALDAQDRYQRLLDLLDRVTAEQWRGLGDLLAGHLERASALAVRLGQAQPGADPETDLLNRQPCAALLLNARGHVVAMNTAAATLLPPGIDGLEALVSPGPAATRARDWLREEAPGLPMCVLGPLARVAAAPVGVLQRLPDTPQRILLRLVDLHWGAGLRAGIAAAFQLTPAEVALVEGLVQGLTTSEYAEQRQRSVHTVRTQLKSILAKTGAGSQNTLIKLVVSLALLGDVMPLPSAPSVASSPSDDAWLEGVAADLHYRAIGPPQGPAVLFLHTALLGPVVPTALVDRARAEGWRLIVPSRPGYGGSPLARTTPLMDTVQRLDALLDLLAVPSVRVIGNVVGALYAHALARAYPQRVREVVVLAGCVPLMSPELQAQLPPMRRLWARLAAQSPQLLKPLARLGAAVALRDGPIAALATAYRQPGADRAALSDPRLAPVLAEGVGLAAEAGPDQFVREVILQCSDWSAELDHAAPLHVMHGSADPIIHPSWVEACYRGRANTRVTWIDGAQQLLAYTHADDWVRAL